MNSSPRRSLALFALGLLASLLLGVTGWALLRDEPGLRFEFFSLTNTWEGTPVFSDIREPRVDKLADLSVSSKAIFSIRWRGWVFINKPGVHDFLIWTDDAGYLDVDGVRILDTLGPRQTDRPRATAELTEGFHTIEVGLIQRSDEVGLGIQWTPPGGGPAVLPMEVLYARRPVGFYRLLRRATERMSLLGRRLLGALLLPLALLFLRAAWSWRPPRLNPPELWLHAGQSALDRVPAWLSRLLRSRRFLYGAFFVALFFLTWAAAFPWSTATLAGDDAAYLRAARFEPESLWYFNRMFHVYLLKVFLALFGRADVFVGSRVFGSFVFAATLAALAVAVRSLGPRLQLRTLAVTIFLLFSQTAVTGAIGAPFADYTLMMILTIAIAVYLHGRLIETRQPRHEWHALVLGALTLAAFKSKETGVIILFLPVLLLWAEGRIDWRRFVRRMAYWLGGFGAALFALMTADAIWLNDFLWAVRPEHLAWGPAKVFAVGGPPKPQPPNAGWMHVIWPDGAQGVGLNLAILWILAVVTPFVAATRRERLDRRLFYLFPATYLSMLIVLYASTARPLYSSRMLIPILPAACLVGGALFYHLGIERPAWKELASPSTFAPLYLAAVVIVLIVTPYLAGELAAEALMPFDSASRFGWQPEQFLRASLVPAVLLAGLLVVSLVFHRWQARLALALVVTVALLGVSVRQSALALSRRFAAQRAEVTLYPWRVFEEEIEAVRPGRIQVSPDLIWRLGMLGRTHKAIGIIFFNRQIDVSLSYSAPYGAEMALASRGAYYDWRRKLPGLEATATFDPSGELVLLRPRAVTSGTQQPKDPG